MKNLVLTMVFLLGATAGQAQTISLDHARHLALGRVPDNEGIKSEKMKTRHGILVYEFDIETPGAGHREIRIDARTGVVVADKHEDDLVGGTAKKIEKAAKKTGRKIERTADKVFEDDEYAKAHVSISEARARRIALARYPGGRVKDIDLETENGVVVWEVEVKTSAKGHEELLIDARTGAVLEQKHKD